MRILSSGWNMRFSMVPPVSVLNAAFLGRETLVPELHRFDAVRIVWLDSFRPAAENWAAPEDLIKELDDAVPTQETIGLWFGVYSECACVIQSRGGENGFPRIDSPLAIPLVAILIMERL